MRHHLWFTLALVFIGMGLFLPQATTHAATVTYTTCPDYPTLSTDASTSGVITFNVAGGCTVVFDESIFIDSTVTITNIGGAVIFDGDDYTYHFDVDIAGNLTLNNLTLYNGSCCEGGSIYNAGTLTVTDSLFDYNYAADYGGAIYNAGGAVSLTNTDFVDNEADGEGGAIYNDGGTLTIIGGSFTGNYAYDYGAVLYNNTGIITISGSQFYDNYSGNDSGVMEIYGGTVTISGSLFYNNESYDDGGVSYIYNDATVNISNSTFFNNTSGFWGGVFYVTGTGTAVNITNSTLYNNESYYDGGALYVSDGNVTLSHATIANNISSTSTGNNLYSDATITLIASIIVNGDCDVAGTLVDGGNNVQFNATGCVGLDSDPLLGAFAGGVMYPALGSPALDIYGAPCLVGNDQLGTARPIGAGCDAGATEGDGSSVVIVPLPVNGPEVLGCVFDTPNGMELSNLPDNTYCTVLMKNGTVINYSGAVPADLIGLGVIFAVDVYRLEGGRGILEFPDYGRVCLRGNGRMFYMDARNAPRYSVEMPTENVDGMTCAWIPAPGTLILTN